MKRILISGMLVCGFFAAALGGVAQDQTAVPTLRVPTLVPTVASQTPVDALMSTSSVGQIAETGVLRAGLLFNDPPYSELGLRGELRGFDVEVVRLMAETWEVDLELLQVTRQNAIDKLNSGDLHLVASAFVHYRALDDQVEFTQTYLAGKQAMMVPADSVHKSPPSLVNSTVGYVLGTRAETALGLWEDQLEVGLEATHYLTLDKAMAALSRGEVAAIVGEEQDLRQVSREASEEFKILEEPLVVEPHALAVRRQDANLRNLLNRTIQYLTDGGQLEVLYREYFPGQESQDEIIYLWDNLGDSPHPRQFSTEINYPAQYTVPRVLQTRVLRVGGLIDDSRSATPGERILVRLNRDLVNEIARRWSVRVEWIDSATESDLVQLQEDEVDLIVGVMPDWRWAGTVDYAAPYLLHGDRLMVPANSRISGFNDLRGRWIGTMIGDEAARARAQAWADSINASVQFYQTREGDAALNILEFDNADAIYANSLALIPHLQASPNALKVTDRWYSRSYYAFAVKHNDIDFRLLVEYTVQELIADGTLQRLSAPLQLSDEPLDLVIIPGLSSFVDINLSGS